MPEAGDGVAELLVALEEARMKFKSHLRLNKI
jgi:hypothetical protein